MDIFAKQTDFVDDLCAIECRIINNTIENTNLRENNIRELCRKGALFRAFIVNKKERFYCIRYTRSIGFCPMYVFSSASLAFIMLTWKLICTDTSFIECSCSFEKWLCLLRVCVAYLWTIYCVIHSTEDILSASAVLYRDIRAEQNNMMKHVWGKGEKVEKGKAANRALQNSNFQINTSKVKAKNVSPILVV